MLIHRQMSRAVLAAIAAAVGLNCIAAPAQTDFVTAVTSTHPLAYYRLDSTSGKSQVGTTTYKSSGGATWAAPGAPVGSSISKFAKLDGHDGKITTTQTGGITSAASIMAWVNLAELPSKTGHIVYVAGESEYGNDLDVQFDTDNALKFYTAAGGSVDYSPPPASLVNQWHLLVVTIDSQTKSRAIYWDGKSVATGKIDGVNPKKNVFTIGESPVFTGRFFKGGIEEVALWNRALKPADVTAIYAAAKPGASAGGSASTANDSASSAGTPMPTTGPFATTAKVQINDSNGLVKLKREEQIAYIFLSGIEVTEHECQLDLQHVCTMDQLLSGAYPKGSHIEHLKFDPNKTDPNYTYTLAANGMAWEAHATAKRPGMKGFCFMARDVGTVVVTYSLSGPAGWTSTPIGDRGMEGDSFATQ
jgi:hypothetical protein